MKKIYIIIIAIMIMVTVVISMKIVKLQERQKQIKSYNKTYETYQNKELYGIDVVSIINKATDNNEKYSIDKDEKGMYIEDEENSVKIELRLISDVDTRTGQPIMVTHQMERLQQKGLDGFITNFNLTKFECREIQYHQKSGKISKLIIEQIEQ